VYYQHPPYTKPKTQQLLRRKLTLSQPKPGYVSLKSSNNRYCILKCIKGQSVLSKGKRIFNIRKEKIEYSSEML